MRAQIINRMYHIEHFLLPHMNRSLNSYLANSHMTRNGVWGTDREIFSPASLLSTDIFVYTQFGETHKWLKFSRAMIDGKKLVNSCSIYLHHSNGFHYDVVQDVCVTDLKHQFSQNSKPDGICNYDKKETIITKRPSENTCHTEQRQTKVMFTEEVAKPQCKKRKPESDQKITHAKEARLVDGQVPFNSPSVSSDNEPEGPLQMMLKLTLGLI